MKKPELHTLLSQVASHRLMAHVSCIARAARTPASEGEKEIFFYLADALYTLGLAPEWHQFATYVSIPEKATLHVDGSSIPCITHAMLPSATVHGELLYIPTPASLPATQAKEKILLIEGLATAPVMHAAQHAGASGVIFIAGVQYPHEMIVSTVWGSPEPEDNAAYVTLPAVTINHAHGELLKKRLQTGTACATLCTETRSFWTDLPILTADIGPMENGYLMLTGHVDSWHQGSMDNASGNAAALEIAGLLAPHAAELQRGVRLVFWSGHSHGRYAGSAAYCDAFFQDIYDNAFLHMNIDCLGGHGATLLSQGQCMAETWDLGHFALHTVTGEAFEGSRFNRTCDQSFWGTGTPSLFSCVSLQPRPEETPQDAAACACAQQYSTNGGYGWWWHTQADTLDKLDPEFLCRDTKIFLAAVHKACTDKRLPIDVHKGFAEFAACARDYAQKAGELLDFSALLHDIACVEQRLAHLNLHTMPTDQANHLILHFEQRLIPLMWVKKTPFGHDSARFQPLIPLLEEVHTLVAERRSHHKHCLQTALKRRINAVRHGVRELDALLARACF